MSQYSNLENARFEDQRQIMESLNEKGVCPFCQENLSQTKVQPPIRDGECWFLTTNAWPYKTSSLHLILIAKYHCEKLADLTPQASVELLEMVQWAEKEFSIQSGGLCMRFGDMRLNGGTVQHLHVHLLVPREKDKDYEPIRFKIG